ncbi:MAG: hypothetical protein HQL07_06265 [Nitrospirae bacterium]|nr:hypothetical protein [Magnetococcales bacterium]
MVLAIQNAIPSMNAQRNVLRMDKAKGGVIERVASGLRSDTAVDDVTGLSIGLRMTSQIRHINQTLRRANDTISMVQVAQGAIEETANALQKIRGLVVEAANDTETTGERTTLQAGVSQLLGEIDRIAGEAVFNHQKGYKSDTKVWKDEHDGDGHTRNLVDSITKAATVSIVSVGEALRVSTQGGGSLTLSDIDKVLHLVTKINARLEGYQGQIGEAIAKLDPVESRGKNSDTGSEKMKFGLGRVESIRERLLKDPENAIQVQANQGSQSVWELLDP